MIDWQKNNKQEWLKTVQTEKYKNESRDRRYIVLNKMWEDKALEFYPKMNANINYTINSFCKEVGCSFYLAKNVLILLNKQGRAKIINNKYYRRVVNE